QNRAVKWNFTKFLINPQGQLVARYAPRTKPETLKQVIEANLPSALNANNLNNAKIIPNFNALKGA
ncbi:MAG: glutathione peroxidase, partial [Pseudomonadota bacterium]|nr:glutathione peroxidase [Pseudomonadota bacterium]